MEVDDDGEECLPSLAPLLECVLPRELIVTVVDSGKKYQSQWSVWPLLKLLFRTKSMDKLQSYYTEKKNEVADYQRLFWPGFVVPECLVSKHEKDLQKKKGALNQDIYLKGRTVPTSLALSWIVWGIMKSKRMAEDRQRAREVLREILDHVLDKAGQFSFEIRQIGALKEHAISITAMNPHFDSELLWTKGIRGRLVFAWNQHKMDAKFPNHRRREKKEASCHQHHFYQAWVKY